MSNDQDALAAEWAAQLDAEIDTEQPATATPAPASAPAAAPSPAAENLAFAPDPPAAAGTDDLASRWAEALATDEQQSTQKSWDKATLTAHASDAQFKDMTDISRQPKADNAKRELDFILDIPLDVSAELGRTRLLINELLQLGQGSVVELNKLAGEPLEVYVNGKLVARGEAVVINEKFGVRLTDIISPMERVKQLG
ncbi:MAG: flagellar motor switch protein FliN [Desulfovibrionaceae bacterium]